MPHFPGLRTSLLPRILHTVVQDATLYFGVMFTSQLILMVFQASARVRCQSRYIPVILVLTDAIAGWSKNDPRTVSISHLPEPNVTLPAPPPDSGHIA